jgi:hypothetical protein
MERAMKFPESNIIRLHFLQWIYGRKGHEYRGRVAFELWHHGQGEAFLREAAECGIPEAAFRVAMIMADGDNEQWAMGDAML